MISHNDSNSTLYPSFQVLVLALCMIISVIGGFGIVSASSDWQQIDSPEWATLEIPPGWTIKENLKMGDDNKTATLTARSPDWQSELFYLLDTSKTGMTLDEMQTYQDLWMQGKGYRICKTKDPVMRTKADHISLKQVYVQGTNKAAVMYSASYPDWGVYHGALLMKGSSAVQQYYESIPPQIPDHIIPVFKNREIVVSTPVENPQSGQ